MLRRNVQVVLRATEGTGRVSSGDLVRAAHASPRPRRRRRDRGPRRMELDSAPVGVPRLPVPQDSGRDGAGARGGWVQGLPSGAAPAADGQPGEAHDETFEKDASKYACYEEAVLACLRDRVGDADAAAGKETVLMVVGGPRPRPRPRGVQTVRPKTEGVRGGEEPQRRHHAPVAGGSRGVAERERDIGRHASRGSAGEGGRAGVGAARIVWG